MKYSGHHISVFFLLTHRPMFEAFYGYVLHFSAIWSFTMKIDVSKIFIIIFWVWNDFKKSPFYFYCLPFGVLWYNLLRNNNPLLNNKPSSLRTFHQTWKTKKIWAIFGFSGEKTWKFHEKSCDNDTPLSFFKSMKVHFELGGCY